MCVISDLFDVDQPDWFNSCLDNTPSRTSSLPEQQLPQHSKHVQLELLTPDADSPEISFNVLTTHSQDQPFQLSFDTDFNPHLPLQLSHSIQLDNHIHIPEHQSFDNHDLLKYTCLQHENSHQHSPKHQQHHSILTETQHLDNPTSHHTSSQTPLTPDDLFSVPDTTLSIEPQSIDQILQTDHQPIKLLEQLIDQHSPQSNPQILTTVTSDTEQLPFDDFYQPVSLNQHPLPDVHTYIATLTGTPPSQDPSIYQQQKPRQRKKRKLSKREAARAASAAEMAREEQLAMLANTKQITDDELLRLKPKKQRRAARFDKPVPSRFCHVCSRTPKNVRLVVCCKIKEGICRKVICEKCFDEYQWGDFEQALNTDSSNWICPHCSDKCPERAQCRTYQRINDRLRVNRLKQEGPRTGKKRTRRQMEQRVEHGDDKRPRFLLPAVAASEFTGFDVNQGMGISGHSGSEVGIREALEQV